MRPLRFAVMPALGEEFRSAREARGLTLSDVAEQIHIRSVYLNAIENDDWAAIGAPVYVRGFIRTYARFLALDAGEAVAQFNETAPVERPAPTATAAGDERERPMPSLWTIVAALVALALVAFVGYEYWQYSQGSSSVAPAAVAPAAQPSASPTGSEAPVAEASTIPSPAAAGRHRLAIRLTQRSWLRVTVDGKTVIEGIFPAGTSRTFTGSIADVRAGNAGGVTVAANGRSPAPMGKDGDVVEQRFTL